MRLCSLITILIVGCIFYTASCQPSTSFDNRLLCKTNPSLYEALIIPNAGDTIAYNSFVQRHPKSIITPDFSLKWIPVTRGLVDTSIFTDEHFNKFNKIYIGTLWEWIVSPLIVEGEVVSILNEDTISNKKSYLYGYNYIVKIKKVIKSKYKIKAGDIVTAKTNLFGYYRNPKNREVVYSYVDVVKPYDIGKTYFFTFDKYHYQENCQKILNNVQGISGAADIYCPYAFSLNIISHELSEDYANKVFGENTIKEFLNIH